MTGESVVLVIDTATETVVTGVVRLSATGEATTLAERTVHDHRRHAEILTTLIGEVLAEASLVGADLDAVVAAPARDRSPACASAWRRRPRTATPSVCPCTACARSTRSPRWRASSRHSW